MRRNAIFQKGDTVVEVLIAVAILGLVLASGFAIANRSLRGIRAAQERGEALKVAETQLERIKKYSDSSTDIYVDGANYCIENDGNVVDQPVGTFDVRCQGGFYSTTTTVDSSSNQYTFRTTVLWDRAGGQGQDTLTLYYKAYKD